MHIILRIFGETQTEMESLIDVCSQVLLFDLEELFQRFLKRHKLLKHGDNCLDSMSNDFLNEVLLFGFLFQMIKTSHLRRH